LRDLLGHAPLRRRQLEGQRLQQLLMQAAAPRSQGGRRQQRPFALGL
jgi:hypothetical protein